jgi:hypothetical protein
LRIFGVVLNQVQSPHDLADRLSPAITNLKRLLPLRRSSITSHGGLNNVWMDIDFRTDVFAGGVFRAGQLFLWHITLPEGRDGDVRNAPDRLLDHARSAGPGLVRNLTAAHER